MSGRIRMDMRPNPYLSSKYLFIALIGTYGVYNQFSFLLLVFKSVGVFLLLYYLFSNKVILMYESLRVISMMPRED